MHKGIDIGVEEVNIGYALYYYSILLFYLTFLFYITINKDNFILRIIKMNNKKLTPLKSIRAYCLDCSNRQPKEVRECEIKDCPLYEFRFGTNPNRKGLKKGF